MPYETADGPAGTAADLPGLADACEALAAGRAVVVPNPSPMTYGVVATGAAVVNAAKGRPLDQTVAASLHDRAEWHRLAPSVDLPPSLLGAVAALLDRRIGILLPLRAGAAIPDWIRPAVRGDQVCVFDGSWAPTRAMWERFPRLFGSSANRTGHPPAASAVDARAVFGPDHVVVDGDALRGGSRPLGASTMVALDRGGRLTLSRSGAHDRAAAVPPAAYPTWLADLVGLPVSRP